ncbi:MAG: carboxypeptidase-like regulatory domain-containing protein [Thiohalospira sp.]
MSKRKLTYKDFINYFSNHLQKKDKHDFEKQMMQDAFEEEAFDGLSKLSESELKDDLAELQSDIRKRTSKSRRLIPVWFRYAASVIILMGIGFGIFFLNSRYWQDSLLKKQVSQEMDMGDSILPEAEKRITGSGQDTFKESEAKDIVADNKQAKSNEKKIQQEETISLEIIDDDVIIEDEVVLEDADEEPEDVFAKVEYEEVDELTTDASKPESTQAIANAASSNIAIRGKSTLTESESPLYVIDGKPFDLDNTRTIQGKVLSTEDHSALPGVTVQLKDMNVFGTVTDTNGAFSITIPDDDELKTLIASFVGMKTVEINLKEDSSLFVYMEPQTMQLDEVVVSQASKKKDISDPVKTSAHPPISFNKYKKEIVEKLDYSRLADFSGSYKVKVSFTVNADGSLSNFNFKNVPDPAMSNEILRVMKDLGAWTPAIEDHRGVSSKKVLTLKIEIEE